MIRFTCSQIYRLELGQDGQFTIEDRYDVSTSYNYIESNNEQFFEAGESVLVYGVTHFELENWEIVGFTDDGMILTYFDGPFEDSSQLYTFASTNSEYVIGQTLPYHTDPSLPDSAPPVCFVEGTLIETSRGAVAIESLIIGDELVGSNGLRTIKWVGWRRYRAQSLRTPHQRALCLPVRILAGALGDNIPSQDLRVSPWHHLFIDRVLIRAKDLVNGKSIVQETNVTAFSYYHVELDQFDVILAHGVFSESWADGGNRSFFQNVDITTLRPKDMQRRQADRPGFKALRKASEIALIRKRIAARAEGLVIEPASKVA